MRIAGLIFTTLLGRPVHVRVQPEDRVHIMVYRERLEILRLLGDGRDADGETDR